MTDNQNSSAKNQKLKRLAMRWAIPLAISISALLAAPWLVGPRCPKRIVMVTGGQDGAYYAFAQQYRKILARQGITLEVRSTAGSVENERILRSGNEDVSLALIQGGIPASEGDVALESLASLYLEPVWVFYRGQENIERLSQLRGKQIAVGPEGSGTRAIALKLLQDNHLTHDVKTGSEGKAATVAWGGMQAKSALLAGEIDAAFFVISPQSPIVKELLQADGIRLFSFQRAAAYRRKYPYMSSVTLPEGLIDFDKNIPQQDTVLLAPAANLVARGDLHHALVPLLLRAVGEVHESEGLLDQGEPFPSPHFVDYPINRDAKRFFRSGPSFLYRYLPFWLAAWLDRVKLVLLPMCTLLLPLLKAAPSLYRWRIRSKIYRWYRVLREIDQKLKTAASDTDFSQDIDNLKNLEHELAEVTVPLSYMEEFYNLRVHITFVLDILLERSAEAARPRLAA